MNDKTILQVKALKLFLLLKQFEGEISNTIFQKQFNNVESNFDYEVCNDLFANLQLFIQEAELNISEEYYADIASLSNFSINFNMPTNDVINCLFIMQHSVHNLYKELEACYRTEQYKRHNLEFNILIFLRFIIED